MSGPIILRQFGPATGLNDRRRSVAGGQHDWRQRLAGKRGLKYSAVTLNALQARSIAVGFANLVKKDKLVVSACCILPRHVHLVVARHERPIEKIAERLKGAATHQLLIDG